LDDLWAVYFAKQKKKQAKEQGISIIVRKRKRKDSGVRGGRE
jgi:hypothetical protein